MRIPDASLDFWCDVYVRLDLRARGLSLDQFLAQPRESLLRHRLLNEALPHVRTIGAPGLLGRLFGGFRRVHDC